MLEDTQAFWGRLPKARVAHFYLKGLALCGQDKQTSGVEPDLEIRQCSRCMQVILALLRKYGFEWREILKASDGTMADWLPKIPYRNKPR